MYTPVYCIVSDAESRVIAFSNLERPNTQMSLNQARQTVMPLIDYQQTLLIITGGQGIYKSMLFDKSFIHSLTVFKGAVVTLLGRVYHLKW